MGRQRTGSRQAEGGSRTATQQTQLAQTYAEAVLTKAVRTRAKVVAKKEVRSKDVPLQPVAKELQRTATKGGYTAVLPARPYRERDLVETGMVQLPPRTPPAPCPSAHRKVLVVGRSREDAWAIAFEALAKPAEI